MAKTDLTAKQEKFVQAYYRLGNQRKAYRVAYNAGNMSDKSIDVKACNLLKQDKIRVRLQVLKERGAQKAVRSVESIDDMLQQSFDAALGDDERDPNPSAMTNAALAIAKLHGLIIDKAKNTTTHDATEEFANLLRDINQPVFPGAGSAPAPQPNGHVNGEAIPHDDITGSGEGSIH
ncbi:MAG: terminase small subunit [Pseudomonadota bacterium]